jgi:hypothetical protein
LQREKFFRLMPKPCVKKIWHERLADASLRDPELKFWYLIVIIVSGDFTDMGMMW